MDMRKGHDGLSSIVFNQMGLDHLSGAIFLFVNKTRRTCKALFFDGTGLVVVHKRLEQGSFMSFIALDEIQSVSMSELALIFEGSKFKLPLSPRKMKINRC